MNQDPAPRAEIIAVGSELLTPGRAETNSLFIAERLARLGARLWRKQVVGDRQEQIRQALRTALEEKAEVVILTGGLGPTSDDITREAVAAALHRRLQPCAELERRLRQRIDSYGLPLVENNLRQAMVPEGGVALGNEHGTAPGLFLEEEGTLIFLLPGPPHELKPMFTQVEALIRERKALSPSHARCLKVAGLAESRIDSQIEPIYRQFPDIETSILSSSGIISLHFTWQGGEDQIAIRRLDELASRVAESLGAAVYSDEDIMLEEALARRLIASGLSLATAESCTGGWLAKMLTDVPGSSAFFLGGFVSYSNALKVSDLGVNETTLERFGAVSPQVAEQMAAGARRRTGADFALSTTGLAGPDGGSAEKPVGLVYLGLSSRQGTQSRKLSITGDRTAIRLRSVRLALDWLRRWLA